MLRSDFSRQGVEEKTRRRRGEDEEKTRRRRGEDEEKTRRRRGEDEETLAPSGRYAFTIQGYGVSGYGVSGYGVSGYGVSGYGVMPAQCALAPTVGTGGVCVKR
jgi:hypothetical protein